MSKITSRDKKVLILDNHDDFGGHAKRNEHTVGGHTLLGEGGSESLEWPHEFGETVRNLMQNAVEQAWRAVKELAP